MLDLKSSFEQLFSENCRWVPLTNHIYTNVGLEKCKKNAILFKLFCPLKIKITQFPDGFRLKLFTIPKTF